MRKNEDFLKTLVDNLDLPDSAYQKALERYEHIGKWLGRENSNVSKNDPHIFPQGSFRLGIAIKPLSGEEEYDLDLACKLRSNIKPETHSQHQLKELIGNELKLYREAHNITNPIEEKHRCWRLEYEDTLKFHMDIVPCVPESEPQMKSLAVSMESYGINESLAKDASENAVSITDNRRPNYYDKSSDWLISNPEGYAQWFESRMYPHFMSQAAFEAVQVDQVPHYKQKTPLQRAVQILKRHRDLMFKDNPESKPISVIITTLSGNSYAGSSSLEATLNEVLSGLRVFIESNSDEVKNPVNPAENFADRWAMPAYKKLELKRNFHIWVEQAIRDFEFLLHSDDVDMISESLFKSLSVSLESSSLESLLGISSAAKSALVEPTIVSAPISKPWHQS